MGGAHRLDAAARPHDSLFILSDEGLLSTRYDKHLLSSSEVDDWYTPGSEPVTVAVDSIRFGCAICIEVQFAEAFIDYERMGVDAVLFASCGIPRNFEIALQAHTSLNCLWIMAATPAQKAGKGPAGIIGPDGDWMAHTPSSPWGRWRRRSSTATTRGSTSRSTRHCHGGRRRGEIYRKRVVEDVRTGQREEY